MARSNGGQAFVKWQEYAVPGAGVETRLATTGGEAVLLVQGRAFYLAGQPNAALAQDVMARLLTAAGLPVLDLPQDIRIRDNGPLRYMFNYGPGAVDIGALAQGAELLLGDVMLGSCGVAVWRR